MARQFDEILEQYEKDLDRSNELRYSVKTLSEKMRELRQYVEEDKNASRQSREALKEVRKP